LLSSTFFTVTSAGDDPTGPTAGIVTLRDAINAVNNDANDSAASPDVINFQLAGTPTITLLADLAAIDNPVTIDGSTQAGVTIAGNGLAMLVDNSTATLNDVTFSGGSVSLGANATLTVNAATNLNVSGDLNAGDSANLFNYGSVSVSGNVVDAGSIGVFNSQTDGATTFTVGGSFAAGDNSFVYNTGTAAFDVTDAFTLGDNGFVFNGTSSTDAATFTVGEDFSVGGSGGSSYLYNFGASAVSVAGNFTLLGDSTYVSNGASSEPTDAASFKVGGNLNLSGGSGVSNDGTSTFSVAGNLALGNDGSVDNGSSPTGAATLTVGGSFSIGDTTAGANDLGYVYNQGSSAFTVKGDFTIYGQGGSYVYNGTSPTDASTLSVGGSFSLGASSFFYEYGSKPFSVTNGFTLGANSFFDDFGTMSVGGNFDPGTGNSLSSDTVGGVFDAVSGSTVTTDTAAWEVLAGGSLDVAAGAAFTVASGGALTVDNGGSVTDQGDLAVEGALASSTHSTIVVDYNGQLLAQGTGQLNVQGLLLKWNNPAASIPGGTALSASQLDATANVPGTFTYTLADGVTPATGAVLPAGNGQILNVTFTPADTTDYGSASAGVTVNVSAVVPVVPPRTMPKLSAPARSTTYTGVSQGYPASAVVVKGVNGLNSSGGILTFAYNGSPTVPTNAGTYTVTVTFTPTNTAEYAVATTTTTWTIKPARLTVHAASESTTYNGMPQAYPLTSGAVTVTGVSSGTDQTPSGTFTYSYASASYGPSSTPPTKAGRYTVTVTFNTSDQNYIAPVTRTATLTITKATPTIAWNTPSAITSTTALGGSQLDAVASVPGTLVYTPAAGTLLSAGTHTLSVKFTPNDSTDYTTATATVKLVVQAPARPGKSNATMAKRHH